MTFAFRRALCAFILAFALLSAPLARAGEWGESAVPLAGFQVKFGGGKPAQFTATGLAAHTADAFAASDDSNQTVSNDEWQTTAIILAGVGIGVVIWAINEADKQNRGRR